MIELKEKQDVAPVCPKCSEAVDEVWFQELKGYLGRRYVYFCSRCRGILGVSHRKGFFMG